MSSLHDSRQHANAVARRLRDYAQPQRLMILSLLCRGEQIVGDIERALGIGQPALSQQLAALRRARLVVARRVAKQVFYGIAGDDVRLHVRTIEALFRDAENVAAPSPPPSGSPRRAPSRPSSAAAFARVGG